MLSRSSLLLVALALAAGCPRQTTPTPASPPPSETEAPEPEPPPEQAPPEPELPPLEPGPCAEGGRLWDGTPQDCSYEHGGCCYDTAAAACSAAGCPAERCNVLESYPAQISCR